VGNFLPNFCGCRLHDRGIDLIAADNPASFIDNTPTAKLVRQVLGAISEFDKAMTVAKLRDARERKRREAGKCEGRKSHAERNPELVAQTKRVHRQEPWRIARSFCRCMGLVPEMICWTGQSVANVPIRHCCRATHPHPAALKRVKTALLRCDIVSFTSQPSHGRATCLSLSDGGN
jgi:hypothetical protein